MTDQLTENKERAQQYFEAIEGHVDGRIDDLDAFVADDVVNHSPASSDELTPEAEHGIEAFRRHAESIVAAFPDIRFDIQDVIAEDDRVMVRFVLTGTHSGEMGGVEPTGEEITMSGIVVYRFEDGKIVERWDETNVAGFLQQVGLLELPAA
jgi:steroid delta-isomerase-like uncharacterized protein